MSQSIRIFSGNLWWGRADSDALVDLIRRHQIDVFAAQELGYENAEAIASELPYGQLEPDPTYQGMGIALRRPATYEQVPLEFRPARRVVLQPGDWDGLIRAVDIVNVHFQAPHAITPFPSVRVRAQQAAGLETYFDREPSDARLVVGDCNATPAWPLYRRLARRFSDAAADVARREGRAPAPTWGPTPESRRMLRIDHAFTDGLRVESFRVVGIPGSDHSGLLFDCQPVPEVARLHGTARGGDGARSAGARAGRGAQSRDAEGVAGAGEVGSAG